MRALEWLMEGDAAIRWQTMRDLMDRPEAEWQEEKRKVAAGGWGKAFLDVQDESGTWGGGIYSPKWTSTTYTLLTLIDCGIDSENEAARRGADRVRLDGIAKTARNGRIGDLMQNDVCVWGFYLHITASFGIVDPLLKELGELLLNEQMEDGGWNCRRLRVRNVQHGSFHTTFNVLEGLRAACRSGLVDSDCFAEAEAKAMEFMLAHRMYKSDRTGEIINRHFTEFAYPPRWHYDVLRGLDYIRETPFSKDPRLAEALELLQSHEKDGIWSCSHKHPGKTHFSMERGGPGSRWNTLRALRVLRTA